uniref:Uncharacterized protein n=1 Tax=Timema douglasi TaxID=61478 RepID=A0A7R8Z8H2_TIMDO|nr:unnamed protein product [Timema douglasi]
MSGFKAACDIFCFHRQPVAESALLFYFHRKISRINKQLDLGPCREKKVEEIFTLSPVTTDHGNTQVLYVLARSAAGGRRDECHGQQDTVVEHQDGPRTGLPISVNWVEDNGSSGRHLGSTMGAVADILGVQWEQWQTSWEYNGSSGRHLGSTMGVVADILGVQWE